LILRDYSLSLQSIFKFKVESGNEIYVHRLGAKDGDKVNFDEVLLTSDGKNTTVGSPTISGASVSATVLEEMVKGDKVVVFKKKRRKGYKVKKGHRQQFSKIKINSITG